MHYSIGMNSSMFPAYEYFTMNCEGYDLPLNLSIDRTLLLPERNRLMKEIYENYIQGLKDMGYIRNNEEIFIVDQDDWSQIQQNDPKTLLNKKRIVIGYSGIDHLKSEVSNQEMNELNSNKEYEELKKSRLESEKKHNGMNGHQSNNLSKLCFKKNSFGYSGSV